MRKTVCILFIAILLLGSTSAASIVCYYSTTGNTKAVAEELASITGSDIFRIEPVSPYTSEDTNWRNPDSRVSRQHKDEALRLVDLAVVTPEDWESYDTVFLGYPIWYGIAAFPMSTFVTLNNFDGKTVIPFCTSTNAGIGESDSLLGENEGGTWLPGRRFREKAAEGEVKDWLETL